MTQLSSEQERPIKISRRRHVLAFLAVLLVGVSWSNVIDNHAKKYVDRTITQAGAAFLTARGLNAFLTVAKSTELGGSVGASVSFRPLEILDPIHDLVEQYSSLMKISIASLLIQKILIEIISTTLFKAILTVFAASFVLSLYIGQLAYANWALKLFLLAVGVRFLFVALVALNALVDEAFTRPATEAKMETVDRLKVELESANQTNEPSEDEKALLQSEQNTLHARTAELQEAISVITAKKAESEQELARVQQDIDNIPRPWFLRRDVPPELRDRRNEIRATLAVADDEIDLFERERRASDARLQQISNRLEGKSERSGWAETLTRLRSVEALARLNPLQQRAESLVDSILDLMALFLMRTLIMPVVFLYLLIKGYKMLWGIDPMSALRNATRQVREEISGKAA